MIRPTLLITVIALAFGVAATAPRSYCAESDVSDIKSEITKRHDEAVKRLHDWIAQISIAAENRGYPEGADYMIQLLKDAGFQQATRIETDGKPGVFATLDAGAPKSVGIYFMYDVKQFDPSEWSSSPTDAAIIDKPELGKAIVGRGAVNQKGPESAFLAALHAIQGAGKKLPVNLVFVAEGEEEIGSPHFPQIVGKPEVRAALSKCVGVFIPSADQDLDGVVTVTLGAKGVIEVELVSSGEKWGRGPGKDIHSSLKAMVDSPAWHLVKALNTLVSADGNTITIDNYPKPKPISAEEKAMIAVGSKRRNEEQAKKQYSVQHWINDLAWQQANERLVSQPTANIEGLVGGYTGPGGKTVLPHKAVAKMDFRLVPDMHATDALAAIKAHLAKHGFGDIEVNMTGGYDPNSTRADSELIKKQVAVIKSNGVDPILWPRSAGSWPGYVFTGDPLKLPAGHFGLGHGSGAHAPNEYYVIESTNPKIQGFDGATMSFVQYLYELAK
ncbi:MAG TPA: M20/M25/M40 family metallo-hydrolase [Chthoniobacterales bacterium]|jgi:acetylornithine deacetylase/succinyl-diaminopimelate desuccinylase-like protein